MSVDTDDLGQSVPSEPEPEPDLESKPESECDRDSRSVIVDPSIVRFVQGMLNAYDGIASQSPGPVSKTEGELEIIERIVQYAARVDDVLWECVPEDEGFDGVWTYEIHNDKMPIKELYVRLAHAAIANETIFEALRLYVRDLVRNGDATCLLFGRFL